MCAANWCRSSLTKRKSDFLVCSIQKGAVKLEIGLVGLGAALGRRDLCVEMGQLQVVRFAMSLYWLFISGTRPRVSVCKLRVGSVPFSAHISKNGGWGKQGPLHCRR